ncbi:MAG TPA: hypothetical protein VGI20_05530 [Rhizomicrobium sp.]|jgi:hypothetical protein
MQHVSSDIDHFLKRAEPADAFAGAEPDAVSKEGSQKIAASGWLVAERLLAQRTGGELLVH